MNSDNLPNGWEWKELSEVAIITMGQSPPSNTYTDNKEDIPFFQGKAEFGKRYPSVVKHCSAPKKTAKKNDILMSVRAPVGAINIAGVDCCIGRGLCSIRPKNMELFYLYHILKSKEKEIEQIGQGSTFKAINQKELRKIMIPVPPLTIQKQIVSILERADKLKEKRQKANEETHKIIQSIFNEMFGKIENHSKKTFLDVFDVTTGKLDSNAAEENGTYPFFTCSRDTFKINSYDFDCEALILAGNNAAGKYSIKYFSGKFNAYQRTYILRLKNKQDSYKFFQFQIENKLAELQRISIGTNTKYLTKGIMKKIIMIAPNTQQQKLFEDKIRQIETIQQIQTKSTKDIDFLFDALMQKAFAGELVA